MNTNPSLYLITPLIDAPSSIAGALETLCATSNIAAVLLRFAHADERTQINRIKILAPVVQNHGTAAIIALPDDYEADIATIAARGGADGIHVEFNAERIRDLADRLKGERSLGVGGLRSRDDAMTSGELGIDYVMFGEPRPDGSIPPNQTTIDRASWWAEIFETPCVAFAQDMQSLGEIVQTGAEFVAIGDALWQHPEGPEVAMKSVVDILNHNAAK